MFLYFLSLFCHFNLSLTFSKKLKCFLISCFHSLSTVGSTFENIACLSFTFFSAAVQVQLLVGCLMSDCLLLKNCAHFCLTHLPQRPLSSSLSLHSGYNTWAHCILIYLFTCLSSLELFEGKDNFLCDLISQNPAKT